MKGARQLVAFDFWNFFGMMATVWGIIAVDYFTPCPRAIPNWATHEKMNHDPNYNVELIQVTNV